MLRDFALQSMLGGAWLVLAVSGVRHMYDREALADDLRRHGLIRGRSRDAIKHLLPPAELLLGAVGAAGALSGAQSRGQAMVAIHLAGCAVFMSFAGYLALLRSLDPTAACGCTSYSPTPVNALQIARPLLLALALVLGVLLDGTGGAAGTAAHGLLVSSAAVAVGALMWVAPELSIQQQARGAWK